MKRPMEEDGEEKSPSKKKKKIQKKGTGSAWLVLLSAFLSVQLILTW